jgi:photosystem II stability/assembly factor-like uncharacterized protein
VNRFVFAASTIAFAAGCGGSSRTGEEDAASRLWLEGTPQSADTEALLQAVSPVDAQIVWASGHEATWLRTTDGGQIWSVGVMEDAEQLQFRDVAAFDANTAYLMSSGTGSMSRIYRTDDGGETWALQYTADHPDAFLDCIDFWDRDRGLAYGDEVDGLPFILGTDDGGATWTRIPAEGLPVAQEGEGGFAASGTCLVVGDAGRAWIASGNAERARVLAREDWGRTWSAVDVPVVSGGGAGLTTIQMAGDGMGIALGGVVGSDSVWTDDVALTSDGGATWILGGRPVMAGPVYGSAWVETDEGPAVLAVGPRGVDWSPDAGRSWQSVDTLTHWAVAFADPGAGWAVGPGGRITALTFSVR